MTESIKKSTKYALIALMLILLCGFGSAALVNVYQQKDANNQVISKVGVLKQRMFYDGSGNLEYLCSAPPGTSLTALSWQVKRFQYDTNGINATDFGGGTEAFTQNCSNRASLSYS